MGREKANLLLELEDALTTPMAAKLLHMSPVTLRTWRTQNYGPPYLRAGGRILYPKARLEKWRAETHVKLITPDTERAA